MQAAYPSSGSLDSQFAVDDAIARPAERYAIAPLPLTVHDWPCRQPTA